MCPEYRCAGAYRRIFQSPIDFEYDLISYNDVNAELADTELTELKGGNRGNSSNSSSSSSSSSSSGGGGGGGSSSVSTTTSTTCAYNAVQLKFTLPPGTYATMLLREITKVI